jgi:hypothetical protein
MYIWTYVHICTYEHIYISTICILSCLSLSREIKKCVLRWCWKYFGLLYKFTLNKYTGRLILQSRSVSNEPTTSGADFSYIFFRGKSLSAEKSAEFLGKTIFQNFFRGKFHFFPTCLGENFPRNFPRNIPQKNVRKIDPWSSIKNSSSTSINNLWNAGRVSILLQLPVVLKRVFIMLIVIEYFLI